MNPICRIDINLPECQKWMDDVYNKCREIFSREVASSAWWQDETPAIYKENIQAMTAIDCHKLKRDLAREVAATGPGSSAPTGPRSFLWWHKVMLVVAYLLVFAALVFLYRCVNARCSRSEHVRGHGHGHGQGQVKIKEGTVAVEPDEALRPISRLAPKKKAKSKKHWLRRKCRHLFVHSEAELRRQQAKREREERVHEEHVKQKIEKWTHARELEEQKRRDKKERSKSSSE
ncbi:uncharacterized protein LOC108161464 [Drosophila miranda]|uniref:uncharacterized protein LOC108161464 n=1 Tax=Drosophila miranda TaxID=7229 RepID=UPI0007E7C233|nr:uncharacterized protein LOC108161464 [Drosophila miranda]